MYRQGCPGHLMGGYLDLVEGSVGMSGNSMKMGWDEMG